MAAIDKTRTDPPDKVEMGGGAAFSSPAANRSPPLTACQQQQKLGKDSGGAGSSSSKPKGGESSTGILSSSSSTSKKQPQQQQHTQQQQQQQQQHKNPSSTVTTTFQLDDNNRFLPNSYVPNRVHEIKPKPRQQLQKQHHHQQQQHDPHQDRVKDNVSNIHDDIKIVLPSQDVKDLNSNTNHPFSPPGTVDSPESTDLNSYNFIKPNKQQRQHEPEKLVNSSHNDPKEYKDNSFSWGHQPTYRDNENNKHSTSNNFISNPKRSNTFDDRKPRHIDEVSVTSSSGTVLSALDRDPKLPFPRSSSPRLVQRQNHVEVPCDDVAIIDIENEDDTRIKSFDDIQQPSSISSTRDSGIKSLFYIGDGEATPTFDDDISRINSAVNSDVEATESSLVLPEVFSHTTCPTSGESSIRSSITEPQAASTGQKVTYRKQKKGNKKKKSNGTTSDQTDEEQSRSSGTKGTRGSGKSSNWRRLRNTLKAANEMKSPKKQNHPLTREDSFLRKFSTRNHNNVHNNSALSDEDSPTDKVPNIPTWTKLVIQHDGNFMFYWLGVVTLSVMYNLWTCIAREGFEEIQTGCPTCWYFLDGVFDVIYILDIVVQFRTGYLDQGLMVYDSKKLRQRYFSSKIIYVDFLCLLPLDFVQIIVGIHPMLRFPRFLKIYRAFRFLHMLESRTAYPNFIRVVSLTHVLFLGAHWFAAFYYMISEAEGFKGSWAYPEPVGSYADVRRKYLKSLYWSTLTLTTIGDLPQPENANEPRMSNAAYVFVIVSYLIGVFVFATIVGQVGNVINNRNASRQEFERLLDGAKVYMQTHNVPQNLQKRVQRWYDYVWSRGRLNNGDINSLGLLPDKLKTELAIHVNLETLKKVTIFQECQPEFLHDLVLKMKAYIFTPGDLICRRGEVAREMFIIADGLVEIISETGTILKRMGAGDFFGEIGILNLDGGINRRSADVRSVGYLELFVLSRDDILGAMKDHPEAESIIRDYGQRRLREVEAHRQRVKPLKCQDSTLVDAPIAGQNVQNRLLMTLRSLSPAVRRESSQLANTGRQSSLQNPPNPPGSPISNSKRCVTQRSSDSHGSSPSVKSGLDHATNTVRKTMSDFNHSSVESFRDHLSSKQHSGSYCEACGNAYYFEDSVMSVRSGGNHGPRRYVSTVYSKIGNLFRKRMGGRRTRSVVYDTPPGMFRNIKWQRGEGPGETGRLSLQQLKSNYCHNCNVSLRFDSSEDHDKSFNSNNNMLSETRGSTETVHRETNHANHEDCSNSKTDTVQICDDTTCSVGDNPPSFGSKIARVIQNKIGWAGNVSYTPVSQGDNEDNMSSGNHGESVHDVDRNQQSLDTSDSSDKFLLSSHSRGGKERRAYLRNRTQSLGSEVFNKATSKLSDKNQLSHVRFSPHSTGSLEHPVIDDSYTGVSDTVTIAISNDSDENVAQTHVSNLAQRPSLGDERIQSFNDVSERLARVSSQSHPDLTTDTGGKRPVKPVPQRRSTTSTISPSMLQCSPTSSTSHSPVPHYLVPDKCTVTSHPTFTADILQTGSHSQHQLRSSEFSSILTSTTPIGGSQNRFSLDHSSDDPFSKSSNPNIDEIVNMQTSDSHPDRSDCNETKSNSHRRTSNEPRGKGHLWNDVPRKEQSQNPNQSHHHSNRVNHWDSSYPHNNNNIENHQRLRTNSETGHIRTRAKRRCKSCGGGGVSGIGGQKRRKGLAIFTPRRTCSIPDLLGDASYLLSLRMRRTSSLDEKLLSTENRIARQGSSCRSDSISRDGSGKKGRSKAMSIMQTPTQDMAFQHLAEQISSMQEMIDTRLASIEESHTSTTHRLDRLAASHELLVRMFKKVIHEPQTARLETQCEQVDSLHSSCV